MGLDMYLYNVKKCSLEEGKTYSAEQLQDFKNLVTCDISDKVCDTIKNHSTKITCIEKVIVPEKLGKLAGIKEPVKYIRMCIQSFDGNSCKTTYALIDEKYNEVGKYTLDDSREEDLNTVLKDQAFEYYAFILEEVDYQRKGLSEMGWSLLPDNCEYCDDYDVVERLTEHGLSISFIDKWKDGKTIFVPWW